ncbi:HNH endonuclease signature motif containing protein [Flectobacillus longus]|uniref:HNH endonuclease signature motif containing protein n=1 Tax=Flectobacillus longus TaxID=2984207 RepID=UPI0024B73553|nr:HNH endonuclease signature motif containing protein [Flectobacillus longus]MDI9878922.1 HNH endonuclease signature motif containing protein [Flectobacillus longus]
MAFNELQIQAVWEKASIVQGVNPNEWRKDQCSAWISRNAYGNRNSNYGWEIDHITAKANGGSDALSNLRPLHWNNNASRQDGRLVCVIKSQGNINTRVTS